MEQTAMSHSFDTHKYIKALVAQGMKEPQAEMIVSTIVESRDFDLSRLATKEQLTLIQKDIDLLKKEIDHIKETMVTKAEFTEGVSKLRTDHNRWMVSILLAIIGMIITMVLKS